MLHRVGMAKRADFKYNARLTIDFSTLKVRVNMATRKKTTIKKVETETTATESDTLSLEEQTAQFLASGGKIQQIPSGVSGQVQTSGPRHITLGKRHQTN